MVADYRGFHLNTTFDLQRIAEEIVGRADVKLLAERLQRRLHELAAQELSPEDPLRILVCPKCASKRIRKKTFDGDTPDSLVYFAMCKDCDWADGDMALNPQG